MAFDVVIVGASIAGCTAATLYGRAGLRVALIEKHRSVDTYKALCGHFVLAGAQDMLRRNGFWQHMVAAGGDAGGVRAWCEGGWSPVPDAVPEPICLRRSRLDPLLRNIASHTPGVELILDQRVVALLTRDGRVEGVRASDGGGAD